MGMINYLVSYNMGYQQILYVIYVCVYNHEDNSTNNFSLMESICFQLCEHNCVFFFSLMDYDQVHMVLIFK